VHLIFERLLSNVGVSSNRPCFRLEKIVSTVGSGIIDRQSPATTAAE
jgi:hypothetical protein